MAESRGMGRGLAAILPSTRPTEDGAYRHVPADLVRPNPDQPRKEFDGEALLALSESIQAKGILQPLVVRALPGGTYELIAGERRLRAAKIAKLEEVPVLVRNAEDGERLELAVMENVSREDLNAVDEARALATLVDDLGVSRAELAGRIGRSRQAVTNLIRILDLPDQALDLIAAGELTEGHGRAILTCRDHDRRRELAKQAAREGWSVRETEARAREAESPTAKPEKVPVPADLQDVLAAGSDALTAALGRDVKVKQTARGYRAEIAFDDPSEAVRLAERILRRDA